ncbi:MAG: outer membrane beta-barrel protein [Candidatus Kapabacteria bacterium]|nr:outer membrane beta-barrel protein [Candidatus Kapabacteria bacterium]
MKLSLFVCLCCAAFAVPASAQWVKGVHYIGARIGLSYVGNAITPALDYEYALTKPDEAGPGTVGIGASIERYAQSTSVTTVSIKTETNTSHLGFSVYGTYHLGNLLDDKRMDPYILFGLYALRNTGSVTINGRDSEYTPSTNVDVMGAAGFRYFFTRQLAGHIRAGFGLSTFSAGITYGL